MRIDGPAEDDMPRDRPDNHAADTRPTVDYEPADRVVLAAEYRSAVDAAYRDYYKAATTDARFQHADADPLRALGAAGLVAGGSDRALALAAELAGEWQPDQQSDFAWLMRRSGIAWPLP